MTNPDIETFFAVLQHGTLSAAAEALYISRRGCRRSRARWARSCFTAARGSGASA